MIFLRLLKSAHGKIRNHVLQFGRKWQAAPTSAPRPLPITDTASSTVDDHSPSDDAADTTLPDCVPITAALHSIVDGINHISNNYEPHFLDLGSRLQAIHSEADQLTASVVDVLSTDRQDSIHSALSIIQAHARDAVRELYEQQRKLTGDIAGLKSIRDDLARLSEQNQHFRQISKNLKMVGLNISIESARSEASKANFQALAEEITLLAQTVHSVSGLIRDDTQAAQQMIETIQNEIGKRSHNLDGLLAAAESMVENAMKEVEHLMRLSLSMLDGTGAKAGEIREQVGRLVVAIQIHDSIAQRAAHINDSIAEAIEMLRTSTGIDLPRPALEAVLGQAYGINRIQTTHLNTIVEDVATVGGQSRSALEELVIAVQAVSYTSAYGREDCALRRDRFASGHPVAVLKSGLERLLVLFDEGLEDIGKLSFAREQTGRTVARMGQHIEKVRDINFEIHLKALNAVIKSSRLGGTGKAIAAVVTQMKELAEQSNTTIQCVAGIMEHIASDSGAADRQRTSGEHDVHRSGRLLRQGIDAFSAACALFDRQSGQALEMGAQLREKIEQSLRQIAFFDTMKADLDRNFSDLTRVNALLQPFAAAVREDWIEEEKRILSRYTMQREREIHRQASEDTEDQDAGHAPAAMEEAEFDEGVELF